MHEIHEDYNKTNMATNQDYYLQTLTNSLAYEA